MKISTGDFGYSRSRAAPQADTSSVGDSIANLGQTGLRIAGAVMEQRQAEAKLKAGSVLNDHKLATEDAANTVADKLETGQIQADQAETEYDNQLAKFQVPRINHLGTEGDAMLTEGIKMQAASGKQKVKAVSEVARRRGAFADFQSSIDSAGKLSAAPGADIAAINARVDALRGVAISAGIPPDQVGRAIQDAQDRNWYNHGVARMVNAGDNEAQLKALLKDVTSSKGMYADRLDPEKKNALQAGIQQKLDRIDALRERASLKRDAAAGRIMDQVNAQISTGIPAKPEMWTQWGAALNGTSYEQEFKAAVKSEQEVQTVLRSPVSEQIAYVQAREASLMQGGGDVHDIANVNRLKAAVNRNVNLMRQSPVLFASERIGETTQPLDFSKLGDKNSSDLAGQLEERAVTVRAMQKQYGPAIPMAPLLPEEAQMLAGAIDAASPKNASAVFGNLRHVAGSDSVYMGMMQQIAKDSPVKAFAGMLAAKERSSTLERNWFSPNVVASSRDVSATVLAGDRIINPSASDKASNGSPSLKLYLPEDASASLQLEFQKQVGSAFAGRPSASESAFQIVKAYYVGKAAETGRLASNKSDVESKYVREAVAATIGEKVSFGDSEVLAPWGMSENQFNDAAAGAMRRVVVDHPELAPAAANSSSGLGLINADGEGRYALTIGRNLVLGKDGSPIVIDVLNPVVPEKKRK